MKLDDVINQIKTYCSVFENRVAGSADYASGLETVVSLPLPACFVYPLDDAIRETSGMGGSVRQEVDERIAVVVEIDNSIAAGGDRRGQTAVTSVEALKYAILAALLNWNPAPFVRYARGFMYDGGHLLGFDRARLFWEFHMVITSTIDQDDGFIPPSFPLNNVTIVAHSGANATNAVANITVSIPLPGLT